MLLVLQDISDEKQKGQSRTFFAKLLFNLMLLYSLKDKVSEEESFRKSLDNFFEHDCFEGMRDINISMKDMV